MGRRARITRFDGAVLADCLFLIGQAWVKFGAGHQAGADEDLYAAERLVPPEGVRAILRMIGAGELPAPGPGPAAMDAWLEACRQAGAGELVLFRILFPSAAELAQEEHEAFLARLDDLVAAANRRMAAGELGPAPPPPPERPPPWEKKPQLEGLAEPGALSDSLRRMGLMRPPS
jgi:hypothetical protein